MRAVNDETPRGADVRCGSRNGNRSAAFCNSVRDRWLSGGGPECDAIRDPKTAIGSGRMSRSRASSWWSPHCSGCLRLHRRSETTTPRRIGGGATSSELLCGHRYVRCIRTGVDRQRVTLPAWPTRTTHPASNRRFRSMSRSSRLLVQQRRRNRLRSDPSNDENSATQ
jgi:hypothetical protein